MNMGLTGGIATGKSTVANMLIARGAVLIDADQIAREVVLPGSPHLAQIASEFGQAVLQEDGSLHRKKLGEIVFNDADARKRLEAITHPPIRALMLERMKRAEEEDPSRLVVVDIPLLFESGLQHYFSEVMLVYVPESIQVLRLMKRDGLDESAALARLQSQMSIEEKRALAHIIIDNSGTLAETEAQIEQFWASRHSGQAESRQSGRPSGLRDDQSRGCHSP